MLGLTLLLTAEAKIAKTDAVLLATVLATQGVLVRAYLSARHATAPPSLRWPARAGPRSASAF